MWSRRGILGCLAALVPASWLNLPTPKPMSDPHDLTWGTYGPPGAKHALKYVRLGDCSTDHLVAILRTQDQITDEYRNGIKYILRKRGNDIS